jgi:alcohol dehydrogenase, propanol-preferring
MPSRMNAAVVEQFGKPLVLREWDIPSPGPRQIVVKTEAYGMPHGPTRCARGLAGEADGSRSFQVMKR